MKDGISYIINGWGFILTCILILVIAVSPILLLLMWHEGDVHGAWPILASILWITVVAYRLGEHRIDHISRPGMR